MNSIFDCVAQNETLIKHHNFCGPTLQYFNGKSETDNNKHTSFRYFFKKIIRFVGDAIYSSVTNTKLDQWDGEILI